MAVQSDYITGTISLTNGEVEFTGTSTGWQLAGFREGDTIIDITGATEYMGVIATIDANGAGTLTKVWEGPTLTDVAYRMRYQPDGSRVTAQARSLIELLGNGNLQALAGLSGSANQVAIFTGPGAMTLVPKTDLISGAAYNVQVDDLTARAAYDGQDEGFAVLVADTGDGRSAIYSKNSATSGDWSDPAYVTGPIGDTPDVTVGTVTTGDPGTDADVTATPVEGGVELDFTIPAGEGFSAEGDYSGSTAYVKGDVVQHQGSSWTALQATTGNTPPSLPTTNNAYWQLLARRGTDGAGTVTAVAAGQGIAVDATDPTEPVVALDIMGESVKTTNYTLVAADYGGTFIADDTDPIEFAFEAAATLGAKWWAVVKNVGTGDLTLNPDGSETIDGEAELVLRQGQSALVTCNGTELRTAFQGGGSVEQLFNEDLTGEFDATQKAQALENISALAKDASNVGDAAAQTIFRKSVGVFGPGTVYTTTSGATFNITGIDPDTQCLRIMFSNLAQNGSAGIKFNIGPSSAIAETGYVGPGARIGASTAAATPGNALYFNIGLADTPTYGRIEVDLIDQNTWTYLLTYLGNNFTAAAPNNSFIMVSSAFVQLSGPMERIRFEGASGATIAAGGIINVREIF